MRLEHGHHPVEATAPGRRQNRSDLCGEMGVVVHQNDAGDLASVLEPTGHPAETRQRTRSGLGCGSRRDRHSRRRGGIPGVVETRNRQLQFKSAGGGPSQGEADPLPGLHHP